MLRAQLLHSLDFRPLEKSYVKIDFTFLSFAQEREKQYLQIDLGLNWDKRPTKWMTISKLQGFNFNGILKNANITPQRLS